MILKYVGQVKYTDPRLRFEIVPNDLVEFAEDEGNWILQEEGSDTQWQSQVLSEQSGEVTEQVQ